MLRSERAWWLPALVVAAALLTGCTAGASGQQGPGAARMRSAKAAPMASPPAFNATDVRFAQVAVAYLQQARAAAKLATGRASCGEVSAAAKQLLDAHDQELRDLNQLVTRWGRSAATARPSWTRDEQQYVISPADERRLTALSGKAFDREFVSAVVRNQQGVLHAASLEVGSGASGDARVFANRLAVSRTSWIAVLRGQLHCA